MDRLKSRVTPGARSCSASTQILPCMLPTATLPRMRRAAASSNRSRLAAKSGFAFRRIIDVRLARTLLHHGVTEFATANVRDFAKLGFERVWNPLTT